MPTSDGFGLFDAPFSSGNGFSDFALPALPTNSVGSSASSSVTTSTTSSGGSVFDAFLGTLGNAVGRVADFGTQLFIFDELAERGQVPTGTATTTTTTGGTNSATTGTPRTQLITGVPNEALLIGGVAVVVVFLLLFLKGK